MSISDTYLGDGVYASFDGYQIWVDTRAQLPFSKIALDWKVLQALDNYRELIMKEVMSERNNPQ